MTGFLLILGIISGILQLLGYFFYIWNKNIEPHPVAWLMFAYGTLILTILEFDRKATISELILPIVCTLLGLYVAYLCWQKSRVISPQKWWPHDWWPRDWEDKIAFVGDLAITVAYVTAWLFVILNVLDDDLRYTATLVFLIGSNLTTITAFIPLLRSTYKNPMRERSLPWFIWTCAYGILFLITLVSHGLFTELIMYPLSCLILHGWVAWLARPDRRIAAAITQ